jgi:ribosomal 50S subunit-recycling heat shock protein
MRVDVFLSTVRLVRPRSHAKRACDNGIVEVDDKVAKPSTTVEEGSKIAVRFTDQDLIVRVLALPGRQVSRKDAPNYYEVLEDRRYI